MCPSLGLPLPAYPVLLHRRPAAATSTVTPIVVLLGADAVKIRGRVSRQEFAAVVREAVKGR